MPILDENVLPPRVRAVRAREAFGDQPSEDAYVVGGIDRHRLRPGSGVGAQFGFVWNRPNLEGQQGGLAVPVDERAHGFSGTPWHLWQMQRSNLLDQAAREDVWGTARGLTQNPRVRILVCEVMSNSPFEST